MTDAYLLALLDHKGILSAEEAQLINALSTEVVPLDYAAAKRTLADSLVKLPPWDGCDQCRSLMLNAKSHILGYHRSGHAEAS